MKLRGKVSWFGGPEDTGVSSSEGLAFIYSVDDAPHLFLPQQPPGTTGLARRLNPDKLYLACRWDYDEHPKPSLLQHTALVRNVLTDEAVEVYPADWGPHVDTDRIADVSPGVMEALGLVTDDEVEVLYPYKTIGVIMPYERIVISSGHGLYVRGASGILDEVDEARRVVERLAEELRQRGVEVETFHDDTSHSQSVNLNTIVAAHNGAEPHDLDVSVHFNAYEQVEKPMGTEVLYVTQSALAGQLSAAIASCGFINRGAKKRTDLAFLNGTKMPSVLLEICFVDSSADAELYGEQFTEICDALANVLGGEETETAPPPTEGEGRPPIEGRPPVERPPVQSPARVDIVVSGDCVVTVNGVTVP